ncbi:MAG: DNA-binding response regulator [Bdellovibrio sp. CG10_big_fil_rev_8_21_14_0_10_47_8]|nr:MAG: DNA-binding response regulator [Bdellovibrio sp. CG10_big_fil_rev_8_21_14_0_10_47_8]
MLRDVLIQKGLSNREAEVAELVSKGLSNKEVANQLFVTEKTVKFHLTNIYKKMSVKSRAQLIVWCLPHLGFVENEVRSEPTVQAANGFTNAAAPQTIPAGNATVGGATPTIIPGRTNDLGGGGGNRGGNSDVGMGV